MDSAATGQGRGDPKLAFWDNSNSNNNSNSNSNSNSSTAAAEQYRQANALKARA